MISRRRLLRLAALSPFWARIAAQASKRPMPDIVVILPGIMGSVLQKGGRDVWAISGSAIRRSLVTLGAHLNQLRVSGNPDDGSWPRV
jgi:hypothetical protein